MIPIKTAVIVPTYNRPAMVERLLTNLSRCSMPADTSIWIVDGPKCGVEELWQHESDRRQLKYSYVAAAGRSLALNHGMITSGADFFVFFDDDIIVPTDMLEIYVDAARRYGPGHFFGGPLVADAETECAPSLLPFLPASARGWSLGEEEHEVPVATFDSFFGANWGVFRSDLEEVGTFAEGLGVTAGKHSPLGEETDLQMRLVKAAKKAIYLPTAVIHHHVPRECYTMAWAAHRQFRTGVTDWRLTHRRKQVRKLFGVPSWIIRAAAEQKWRSVISALTSAPIKERTEATMRAAYLNGLLYGAWTERRAAMELQEDRKQTSGHLGPGRMKSCSLQDSLISLRHQAARKPLCMIWQLSSNLAGSRPAFLRPLSPRDLSAFARAPL